MMGFFTKLFPPDILTLCHQEKKFAEEKKLRSEETVQLQKKLDDKTKIGGWHTLVKQRLMGHTLRIYTKINGSYSQTLHKD